MNSALAAVRKARGTSWRWKRRDAASQEEARQAARKRLDAGDPDGALDELERGGLVLPDPDTVEGQLARIRKR